jgi:hypothetical protein
MKRTPFMVLIAFAAAAVPLAAQIQFGLDNLASKAKESVDITLDASMLRLAGGFLSKKGDSDNQAFQKMLAGLKNVTVKSFTFAEEGQYKIEDLQPIRDQLRKAGWTTFINVREKTETTEIYSKSDAGGTQSGGLALLVAEPKELTVIYIEGAIDLSGLANLAGHFGIPDLPIPGAKSDSKKTKGNQ